MLLPWHLVQFWYFDSAVTLVRTWRNLLFLIEEDMAVGLMWRLLFTPLFHDTSFVGRILSLIFRLVRIVSGLVTMLIASLLMGIIALVWFTLPVLFVLSFFLQVPLLTPYLPENLKYFNYLTGTGMLFGLSLFTHHLIYHPVKKIWQIQSSQQIWHATKLKPDQITMEYLQHLSEVKKLLTRMEIPDMDLSVISKIDSARLCEEAFLLAKARVAKHITANDFFIAYLKLAPEFQHQLIKRDLTIEDFINAQIYLEETQLSWRKVFIWDEDFHTRHLKGVNRGWLGMPTPFLDAISTDLTQVASFQYFEDFFGRKDVLDNLLLVLSQDNNRNALLVGEPGVGKSTLVHYLAKIIIAGDAPEVLATKRIVRLEINKLLSGVRSEGDLAEKMKNAFQEVQMVGDIIVYIDEIHELGIGDASHAFNLYSLLMPFLESNSFQFIASTEPSNYARTVEKEGSLARLFHKIEVPEASVEETLSILKLRAIETLMAQKTATSYPALVYIAHKAKQFIHDRRLPDSAIYLFDECKAATTTSMITTDTVKTILSKKINMPIVELDVNQKKLLLQLEEVIHSRMIAQDQAVKSVADTLRRAATSLREESRPIGSFLFVGPTGVGKTELAKILSEVYFKQRNAFVRFDMSEYQSSESVNRLIGTSENPGELTEIVKNKPYCLLLLDEFEKASPQILTLFLQVLEDGRLTGGDGKTVDFTNTIIIATSNAGSLTIAHGLDQEKPLELVENDVRQELLKIMKPELVNRFDSIVIFKPLSQFDLEEIVKIKLQALKQKLLEQGYVVDFSSELIAELARRGYDPVLGARPLRRLIQDTLESNLSKLILTDKIQKGEALKLSLEILN